MTLSLNFSELKPLLTDGCLILTPNARTQQAIYAGQIEQVELGKVVAPWEIKTFSQWQSHLWSELSFLTQLPKILSKQSLRFWLENQIENEPEWNLTNVSGVAGKVVEAYQNLVYWELTIDHIKKIDNHSNSDDEHYSSTNQLSEEVIYFIKWVEGYQKFSLENEMISSFEQLKVLIENLDVLIRRANAKVIPKSILLVGFNQLTPLEKSFFKKIESFGISIENHQYKKECRHLKVMEFESVESELVFASTKAKNIVDGCNKSNVTVVVNQLSDKLEKVFSIFSKTFKPEEYKPWQSLSKPTYNVSAGLSLADQSIIKAAQLILNLKKDKISLDDLFFIKNTHYFYWGEQRSATQYFLHQLCLKGRNEFKVNYLLSKIEEFEQQPVSLSKLKARLLLLLKTDKNRKTVFDYKEKWREKLELWGWGINKSLVEDDVSVFPSDVELKMCSDYLNLFSGVNELLEYFDRSSEKEALNYLNQLAQQTVFQVPSDRSRVQVLGVLEATGLQFESLIMVGFNSETWPSNNKSNPFLPSRLQSQYQMPGGSAEREFNYTKSLSDILISSADEIIVTSSDENSDSKNSISTLFSEPGFNRKGDELNPSVNDSELMKGVKEVALKTSIEGYQWVEDPVLTITNKELSSGTGFLSQYADCPFSGFLKYYLKASNYEEMENGIDARQRGVWLHDTMQAIWIELKEQVNLKALNFDGLNQLIEEKLENKLNEIKPFLLLNTNEIIIDLEKQKLHELISQWLEIDKEREPFTIKQLESEKQLTLSDIKFNFRLDRVDDTGTGQTEIIDYKTGNINLNDWFSVRPTEAQMPAYMLAFEGEDISSINYARIKKGMVGQIGLKFSSQTETTIDKNIVQFHTQIDNHSKIGTRIETKETKLKRNLIDESYGLSGEGLKKQWRKTLERMAFGMSSGFFPVSPKDKNKSCTYCDYRSVCRIDERQPESKESIDSLLVTKLD